MRAEAAATTAFSQSPSQRDQWGLSFLLPWIKRHFMTAAASSWGGNSLSLHCCKESFPAVVSLLLSPQLHQVVRRTRVCTLTTCFHCCTLNSESPHGRINVSGSSKGDNTNRTVMLFNERLLCPRLHVGHLKRRKWGFDGLGDLAKNELEGRVVHVCVACAGAV